MTDIHDTMADPRDYRKRLADMIFVLKGELETIHDAVEKGDKSLIYQHDFRLSHLMGLTQALKMFDDYQKELREAIESEEQRAADGDDTGVINTTE